MPKSFGELVHELRISAGFGLRRFAEMVGIKASNLSDIEHGRRLPPSDPNKLREVAEALGLAEDSEGWKSLFDAARRQGELPADIRHMADRKLVPALLRTIDNQQLDDEAISRLISEMEERTEGARHVR